MVSNEDWVNSLKGKPEFGVLRANLSRFRSLDTKEPRQYRPSENDLLVLNCIIANTVPSFFNPHYG